MAFTPQKAGSRRDDPATATPDDQHAQQRAGQRSRPGLTGQDRGISAAPVAHDLVRVEWSIPSDVRTTDQRAPPGKTVDSDDIVPERRRGGPSVRHAALRASARPLDPQRGGAVPLARGAHARMVAADGCRRGSVAATTGRPDRPVGCRAERAGPACHGLHVRTYAVRRPGGPVRVTGKASVPPRGDLAVLRIADQRTRIAPLESDGRPSTPARPHAGRGLPGGASVVTALTAHPETLEGSTGATVQASWTARPMIRFPRPLPPRAVRASRAP